MFRDRLGFRRLQCSSRWRLYDIDQGCLDTGWGLTALVSHRGGRGYSHSLNCFSLFTKAFYQFIDSFSGIRLVRILDGLYFFSFLPLDFFYFFGFSLSQAGLPNLLLSFCFKQGVSFVSFFDFCDSLCDLAIENIEPVIFLYLIDFVYVFL